MTRRPHPARVALAATIIGALTVAAGAAIGAATRTITGHTSPLPANPPWRWSPHAIVTWLSRDAGGSDVTDVAVRVLAVVLWVTLVAIAWTLLRELATQTRHASSAPPRVATAEAVSVPSPANKTVRFGRGRHAFAATFVSLILGATNPATARVAAALPARHSLVVTPTVLTDAAITSTVGEQAEGRLPELPVGWRWRTYTVTSAGESLRSIAETITGDADNARLIWEANHHRTVAPGSVLDDPAVIRVGWTLQVPDPAPARQPAGASAAPPVAVPDVSDGSAVVTVAAGDNLWTLIEHAVGDTPTGEDVAEVAVANDHTPSPDGRHTFAAAHPELINPGQTFDLQPAIDNHHPAAAPPAASPSAPSAPSAVPAVPVDRDPIAPDVAQPRWQPPASPIVDTPHPTPAATPTPPPPSSTQAPVTTTAATAPPPATHAEPATSPTTADATAPASTGRATPATAQTSAAERPSSTMAPAGASLEHLPPAPPASNPHDDAEPSLVGRTASRFGGTVVLASALALVLHRQRRRRVTQGTQAVTAPAGVYRDLEADIVTAADVPLTRWAGQTIAQLVRGLDPATIDGAPVAVELDDDGLEILWQQPNPTAPEPWESRDGGWTWYRHRNPNEPVPTDELSAPIPALVTVGHRNSRQLLVNLDAYATIDITGTTRQAVDYTRALALELAAGDELANATVHTIGIDLDTSHHLDRIQPTTTDTAITAIQQRAVDAAARHAAHRSGFHANCATDHPEPADIVIVGPDISTETALALGRDLTPHDGQAVITINTNPRAGIRIALHDDNTAELVGLGGPPITITTPTITRAGEAELAVLLDDSPHQPIPDEPVDDPPSVAAETAAADGEHADATDRQSVFANGHTTSFAIRIVNGDDPSHPIGNEDEDDGAWVPPTPEILVRVLGRPTIPTLPEFSEHNRAALNVVAYLACHDRPAPRDKVANAVWGGALRNPKTVNNVIGIARRALASDPAGQPYLPATGTSNLTLHHGVNSDLDLLRQLVHHAEHESSSRALPLLDQALDLIDGEPFDDTGYEWAEADLLVHEARQLIETAAHLAHDHATATGNTALARSALVRAAKGLKGHEPLARLHMQLEHDHGDASAVHAVWQRLDNDLRQIDATPCDETRRCYRRLSDQQAS